MAVNLTESRGGKSTQVLAGKVVGNFPEGKLANGDQS